MSSAQAAVLEHELSQRFSALTLAQKREVLDFTDFISSRSSVRRPRITSTVEVLFDLAPECQDTDLAENHDQYLYGQV